VVLLRFNGAAWRLERAVRSVLVDERDSAAIGSILLVDNASTEIPEVVDEVAEAIGDHRVTTLHSARNFGFSGGVNRGIAALDDAIRFVLLLNDDAWLHPGALALLVNALSDADESVFAVAPKLYLEAFPGVIESAGMTVNAQAEANNIGLGQFDIGQFDTTQRVLGPSFAAALIRREAFHPDQIGPLAVEYFLYYEDVEWNWRANVIGREAITCPAATGVHEVSASSRSNAAPEGSRSDAVAGSHGDAATEASYAFKHRFIEANLLATAARCLEPRAALSVWAHRYPRLVKARVTGRFPRATFGAALDAARQLPCTLAARRHIQRRRKTPDSTILALAPGLPILFDPVTYQPDFTWGALVRTAESALSQATSDDDHQRFSAMAKAAQNHNVEGALAAFNSPAGGYVTSTDFEDYLRRLS
jgi:GT2 family glycosyltransferase